MTVNLIKIDISKKFGKWFFFSTLIIVIGIIITVIIIEKGKLVRIEKFQKMSESKIKIIGYYEGQTNKEYPINLSWNKNNKD